MTAQPLVTREPLDDVRDRLNDPAIASAVVLLLDNVEALAFLAMGVNGFLQRGQTIADTLADGLADFRSAGASTDFDLGAARAQAQELLGLSTLLTASKDDLAGLLGSGMLRPEVIGVLSQSADALVEARQEVRGKEPEVTGIRSLLRVLKDGEVQKGLSFLIAVARSLGRRVDR